MSDPVQAWLNNAGRYPLLPKSEALRLAKKRDAYEVGSREYIKVINKLCEHNLRLVPNVVRRYLSKRSHFTMNSEVTSDLLQQGYLGLRRAAEKFDGRKGFTFSTYAYTWVFQSIIRWHNTRDRAIYVPENAMVETLYRRRHGCPSGSKNGKIGAAVVDAASLTLDIRSLDRPAGEDDEHTLLEIMSEDNRIIDRKSSPPNTKGILKLKDLMAECGIKPRAQDVVLAYAKRGRMSVVAYKLKLNQKHCQNMYGEAVRIMKNHVEGQATAVKLTHNQPH